LGRSKPIDTAPLAFNVNVFPVGGERISSDKMVLVSLPTLMSAT